MGRLGTPPEMAFFQRGRCSPRALLKHDDLFSCRRRLIGMTMREANLLQGSKYFFAPRRIGDFARKKAALRRQCRCHMHQLMRRAIFAPAFLRLRR